jgi:HAE1 family hydrophobic/amphiphilic exporter-1
VYANVEGTDIGSVSDNISLRIQAFRKTLPKGYEVNFEGEVAVMKRSFANLGLGLILAVLFAFLIITPLFKSFRQPLIIILAFPLGLIGIVALMMLTRTNLSIQSIMGIIMMVGISVSYGNILIDRINNLIREGMQKKAAIINGASDRFRPVLMTAATTVFALLPTAIGIGESGGENVPLAIAVIGGTITATFLTLYIIPIFYLMIAKTQHNEN